MRRLSTACVPKEVKVEGGGCGSAIAVNCDRGVDGSDMAAMWRRYGCDGDVSVAAILRVRRRYRARII